MIHRLLYVSTAADALTAPELEAILRTAQARNAALGLTGLLVFTGRHFMQLLEGEPDAVEAVFAAICADERHHDVAKLIAEPAQDRAFPDWSMALQTPEGAEVAPEQAFVVDDATIRESLPMTMPGDLQLLFRSFNSVMEPRAASA